MERWQLPNPHLFFSEQNGSTKIKVKITKEKVGFPLFSWCARSYYIHTALYIMRTGVQLGRVEAQPVPNVNEDAMPESEPDRSDSGSGQAESEREGEEKAVQEFEVTEAA